MKELSEILKNPAVLPKEKAEDGGCGWVDLGKGIGRAPFVIWSNGGGWDHVSVSFGNRCPTWEEMCKIKDVFFGEEEECVEYHPRKSEYVNIHPNCLHIWRPQDEELPTPPRSYV